MCGIAGYVRFAADLAAEELHRIGLQMAKVQSHRGPDDEGVWLSPDGRCVLAHRRLSVIDTSAAGHQPMESQDARHCISYNGEIYNYREIRSRLQAKGHSFQTESDTEVLLAALDEFGDDVFEQLDGMYGFGHYSNTTGELLLARDPFGEKPLYTLSTSEGFAFASELEALRCVPGFDTTVELAAVAEFLCFQYIDAPRSFYKGTRKIEPGSWLRVGRDGHQETGRHFTFRPGRTPDDGRSLDDYADELEGLLLESIRRRLIADVPLGAFLSGGVDSSTIVALIRRKLGLPVKTFSIGFRDSPDSEHELAATIAKHLGTEHRERVLPPAEVKRFAELGGWLDEPNADTSCLPTYLLSQFTREEVTVAVSGDGGDELFAGYGRYLATLRDGQALEAAGGSIARAYGDRILLCSEGSIRELLGFMPRATAEALATYRSELDDDDASPLARMRASDVRHYLPGAVLAKVDRMSMQHALEVRTPFLNREIARFAEGLPERALSDGQQSKLVLRRLASRYLPPAVTAAPKKGFGLPMSPAWAGEGFLQQLKSLGSREGPLVHFLGDERLDRFRKQQEDGSGTTVYRMAAIVVLDSFLRSHPSRLPVLDDGVALSEVMSTKKESPSTLAFLAKLRSDDSGLSIFCRRSIPTWVQGLPARTRIVTPLPVVSSHERPVDRWDWEDPNQSVPPSLLASDTRPAKILLFGQDASAPLGAGLINLLERRDSPQLICRDGQTWAAFKMTPGLRRTRKLIRASSSLRQRLIRGGLRGLSWLRRQGRLRFALPLLDRSPILPLASQAIRHNQGFAFQVRFASQQVDRDRDLSSEFVLYEDGRPLAAPGTDKREIRQLGGGRYCLVNENAFFSTQDGSDPRTNGRDYFLMRRSGTRLGRLQWLLRDLAVTDLSRVGPFAAGALTGDQAEDALRRRIASATTPVRASDASEGDSRRLVMITASLGPGGAERQLTNLALRFTAMGHRVEVIAIEALTGPRAHYWPALRQGGVPVSSATAPSHLPDLHELLSGLDQETRQILAGLPRAIRDPVWGLFLNLWCLRPDAVYCQLDSGNILGGVAASLAGVPRILLSTRNVNPSHFPHMHRPWFKHYYEMLMGSDRVRFSGNSQVGNDDYARWLGMDPERFLLIRNGLLTADLDQATTSDPASLRRELEIPEHAPLVLGVFRLSPEKRPELFLSVVEKMIERVPELRVLHAGQGPMAEEIARRVAEHPILRDRMTILGRRTDAHRLIHAADLLVLTSHQEGTPNVVLEAQYLGTPVLCCDAGGASEAVADGESGSVCKTDDPDEIAELGVGWLTDSDRRSQAARAGRRFVEEHFSLEKSEQATLRALFED